MAQICSAQERRLQRIHQCGTDDWPAIDLSAGHMFPAPKLQARQFAVKLASSVIPPPPHTPLILTAWAAMNTRSGELPGTGAPRRTVRCTALFCTTRENRFGNVDESLPACFLAGNINTSVPSPAVGAMLNPTTAMETPW